MVSDEPPTSYRGRKPTSPLAETSLATTVPAVVTAVPFPLRLALRNFVCDVLLTLTLFVPYPRQRRFSGDPGVVALALAVVAALTGLVAYASAAWRSNPDATPVFNAWGIHTAVTLLFVQAALLFFVAVANARLHRLSHLLAGLLAVEIVALTIEPLLGLAESEIADRVFFCYCLAVLLRIVFRELADIAVPRRLLACVAVGATLWLANDKLPSVPLFRSVGHQHGPLNVERVYLAQERLVQAALDAVRPSRTGVTETYFVGFAPYSAQNVFENEAKHVETLFRERLGAAGRTALLVNSPHTVDELPLANGHNLAQVLAGVAAKMDAEDVLFLHMTSHGSQDHQISVYFDNLGLNDLGAEEIGDIVAGAGLPWQVIVVAACYSGGYIEALKSPRTLVMTASRADRQSFGCSHGREYTYFGEAFYRDSLEDADYRGAFEHAREVVSEREKQEGLTPSEPQIWIGEEIAKKLGREAP